MGFPWVKNPCLRPHLRNPLNELWVHRDPLSTNKVGSNQRRPLTLLSGLCTHPCMHAYTLLCTHPYKSIHTLCMCAYRIKYKSCYNLLPNESIETIQSRSGHILFPLVNTSFSCFVVEVSNSEFFIFVY